MSVARRMVVMGLALAGLMASAVAQTAAGGPPLPRGADKPPVWIYYLVILVLAGLTVVVSIMPSKRGHLD
jgi:hypothetical protein